MPVVATYNEINRILGNNAEPLDSVLLVEKYRLYFKPETEQVVTSANPERVICVGKGVARVVVNDLQALFPGRYEVISQPNARISSAEHMANFQRYYEICNH